MTESIQATSIYRFDFLRSTAILRFPASHLPATSHLPPLPTPASHLLPHLPSPPPASPPTCPPLPTSGWRRGEVGVGVGGMCGSGSWEGDVVCGKYNEPRKLASSIRSMRSSTRIDAGVCGWFAGPVLALEASRVRLPRAQREKKNMWPSGQSNQKSALQVTKAYAALLQHYLVVATARLPPLQELVKQKA